MPKILVTGGAGYIGAHTTRLLGRCGFEVLVVDDLSRGRPHNVQGFPFTGTRLSNTGYLTELLRDRKVDAVIHFAAYISVGESASEPALYFSNNVGGTASLLMAMAAANVNRLVFSSSAAVYGDPASVPIAEDAAIAPVSPYGETKAMVEKMLGWMDGCRDFRSVALRYFNACGADPDATLGEEHNPETHLIPLLFRAIQTGEPVTIFGEDYDTPDGTCIRDYVHVSDLAEAHLLAVRSLLAGGPSNVFNVGTGTGHSVKQVIRAVESVTGAKVPVLIGPRRDGDAPVLVADSGRLRRTLGWTPQFPELERMVATAWAFERRYSRDTI